VGFWENSHKTLNGSSENSDVYSMITLPDRKLVVKGMVGFFLTD
jgi:hypothetical protein